MSWSPHWSPPTVPAGPVLSVGEAVDGMQSAHGGLGLQELDGMRLAPDPILVDGEVDGERTALRIAPPHLGQHTTEVHELGCDEATIARYYEHDIVR